MIGDPQVKRLVTDMVAQQDPVARALNRMQRDGVNVGKSMRYG